MTIQPTPIYDRAARDHGFAPMTQAAAYADECYRCPTDPAGRIDPLEPEPGLCRGCLDEVSHAIEQRHLEGSAHQLGDDGTDGGRWVS